MHYVRHDTGPIEQLVQSASKTRTKVAEEIHDSVFVLMTSDAFGEMS
jgi:hypothetical protein